MKFTCQRNALMVEVSVAQDIIASRSAFSVLSNVYLEVNDNQLTIKATDLKIAFQTTIPVEVTTPGSTTVFCDKFLNILRSLPEGDVEFDQQQDSILSIRPVFKKIDFELKCIPPDKYPELQRMPEEAYFDVAQSDIVDMISKTVFAVSDDETRYYMNGAYLERQEQALVMVATDGRRLSFVSKKGLPQVEGVKGIIVPPKILQLVKKLSQAEGNLSLSITDKNIFIALGNHRLSSTLIEGQFPNYHRVIPEGHEYQLVVRKDALEQALRRISLLVENKSRKILLHVETNRLLVSAEETEIGKASEEIDCEYDGPDVVLALNYVYMLDPLREFETENVSIEFSELDKAMTLKPFPETDHLHIIMPMQAQTER